MLRVYSPGKGDEVLKLRPSLRNYDLDTGHGRSFAGRDPHTTVSL